MSTQTTTRWVPSDTFGARLALLRRQLRLTTEEIADLCGLNRGTWQTWEKGASPRNMNAVVAAISLATGVDKDWLMWGGPLGSGPPHGPGLPRLDSDQQPPGLRRPLRSVTSGSPFRPITTAA